MTYMTKPSDKADVVVIGGGAAGMMAAISAAQNGARVILLERNERCGRKLGITGKGRCNLTNDCTVDELLQNVPTNPRFLYAALNRFSSADTMAFFEDAGVPLKVERGRRVFPVSDKAADVVDALVHLCHRYGVQILRMRAKKIECEGGAVRGVFCENGFIEAAAVILCTGGKSYPRTGSDGDGYAMAREMGHEITPIQPSLVPMTSADRVCARLQGLSLRNVALQIRHKQSGKKVYTDFGEMMFTHFGMTGPMILSASAHIPDATSGCYEAHIDLKPAMDDGMLNNRLQADFRKYQNKDFINALDDLLPQKLIPVIVERTGIGERRKVNSITKEERQTLLRQVKDFTVGISGFRSIDEAIITKGGVNVKGVLPGSMASRLVEGLFFAGEILDVDAYTGGYNLQIAFATGVLAGENAAYFSFAKEK